MIKMKYICTICFDILDAINPTSVTTCCHVFHSSCLTKWLHQSKSCPECRSPANIRDVKRLYLHIITTNDSELNNKVSSLKVQLTAKEAELSNSKKLIDKFEIYIKESDEKARKLQEVVDNKHCKISELDSKVSNLKVQLSDKAAELSKSEKLRDKFLIYGQEADEKARKLQQMVENKHSKISELDNKVSYLKVQLSAKEAELLNSKKLIDKMTLYGQEADEKAKKLQQIVNKIESKISELDNKVSNLKIQLRAKEAESSNSKKLIHKLAMYSEEADEKARKLEQTAYNKDSKILELHNKLSHLKFQLSAKEVELSNSKMLEDKLTSYGQEAYENFSKLQQVVNNKDSTIMELDNEVYNLKVQLSVKKAVLSKSQKLVDKLLIYGQKADEKARKLLQIVDNKVSKVTPLRFEILSSLEENVKFLELQLENARKIL